MSDESVEPQEERYYFHYCATLRIFGHIPDLDEISTTLGISPTSVGRRGEVSPYRVRPFEHDRWAYTAPVPEDRPLDVHIRTLWSHIKPHRDYLRGLKDHLSVDVFCGYRSNCSSAGFEISYLALEMFTQLEIPFGVSIIV